MTTYAYYPGCSLETSAKEFDSSVRAMFDKLGVELKEIPDWSCCGSSQAHKVDRDMATAIAGRNLSLASNIGDIMAPCASCFLSLKEAVVELEHDGVVRSVLKDAGFEYLPGSVRVLSAVEAAHAAMREGLLEGKITNPLKGLRVASYYGCLLVRPAKIARFDDPENPKTMDELMSAIGASPVSWNHKTSCCANAYILINRDMALKMIAKILNGAIDYDADVIVAACPLCEQNLASRHSVLEQNYGLKDHIPVLYFSQLIGLAMGIDASNLQIEPSVMNLIRQRQHEFEQEIVEAVSAKEVG